MAATGTYPYITQQMAREIEAILNPHLRDGENCVQALERLLREKDVETYDRSIVEGSKRRERELRMMFAAAIQSAPDRVLRISRKAIDAIGMRDEILTGEDFTTGDYVYRVVSRG